MFDFDRADPRVTGRDALDRMLEATVGKVLQSVRIDGHADRIGTADYNQRLSEQRAGAVRDYRVSRGAAANQLPMAAPAPRRWRA